MSIEYLFQLKKEIILMMRDRNFDVSEEAKILEYKTAEEFQDYLKELKPESGKDARNIVIEYLFDNKIMGNRSLLSNVYCGRDDTSRKCIVYVNRGKLDKKVGKGEVKPFIKLLLGNKIKEGIFISENELTPQAASYWNSTFALTHANPLKDKPERKGYFVQQFTDVKLMYNPLNHVYAPKYRLMNSKEAKDFLERNKIKPANLPLIDVQDPVCRRLGIRPGQILEIVREIFVPYMLVNKEISYRIATIIADTKKTRKKKTI